MNTAMAIGPRIGIAPGCSGLGVARATFYRAQRPVSARQPRASGTPRAAASALPPPLGSKPGSSRSSPPRGSAPVTGPPEPRFNGSPAWIEAHHRSAAHPIPVRLP